MNFKLFGRELSIKILKWAAFSLVLVAALIIIKDESLYQLGYYENGAAVGDEAVDPITGEVCNVALVKLHGELYIDVVSEEDGQPVMEVSSTDLIDSIEKAEKDIKIKAIVLDINSMGGSAIAGQEVFNAMKRVTKPKIAVIRGSGLPAAYWAAIGADVIYASTISDAGSIGITSSYLDNVGRNEKEGLYYNQLSSAVFKDLFSADKQMTVKEKELIMRDVNITAEHFIKDVSEKRGLEIGTVRKLADGSSMLGEMALKNGLIDKLGGMLEVKEFLQTELNEPAVLCDM